MKVLLIYPPYTHRHEFDQHSPSMALFYIAAELERRGHSVQIYDASLGPVTYTKGAYRYGRSDEEIVHFLKEADFDMVGITCSFTARWRFVADIARRVKEVHPGVPVAVGGLFPTTQWEYCFKTSPDVDIVFLGEAEMTFGAVVDALGQGRSLTDACQGVDGVAWRVGQQFFSHPKEKYIDDLDALPFPAWHLVNLGDYFKVQRRIYELPPPCLPILSSRSCPNRCSFCNMYLTHGRRFRMRSAENVLAELEYLQKRFNVHRFYFVDDNFSLDPKRAKIICQAIIDRGWKINYNFFNGLSIKTLDFELIQLMKASGCTSVCLAVESGSERIRNGVYRKNLKTEKIVEVFENFHKVGIATIGFFMVGAPGETREDFEMTKALIKRLPMTLATAGVYTPYPQTDLYDECKAKGWLLESDAQDENRRELYTSLLKSPEATPADVESWPSELYLSFIKYHWPTLLREAFRPGGLMNKDMIGNFWGALKLRFLRRRV